MTDTIHTLIEQYGLIAVFIACVAEGETAAILAGFFAHRGYMSFAAVVAVATFGAFCGDQFWFWLGRNRSAAVREASAKRRYAASSDNNVCSAARHGAMSCGTSSTP